MKVLVVSGDSSDTNKFLLGVMSSHQCKVHSLLSDQVRALVEKYGDMQHVPAAEINFILYESSKQTLSALDSYDPDVVLGIGMGANVLSYLIAYGEWRGASVLVDPMPISKSAPSKVSHSEEIDEVQTAKCAWVLRNSFLQSSGNHVKKISYFKDAIMTVYGADDKFDDVCGSKTILAAIDAVT